MRRVASLYLPQLATERLRRSYLSPASPDAAPAGGTAMAPVRGLPVDDDPGACSAPRGGGWRPGARWAQGIPDAQRELRAQGIPDARDGRPSRPNLMAQIEALPPHRRPPMRELGRRSEAAPHPFKALPGDDGGAVAAPMRGPARPTPPIPQPPLVLVQATGGRELLMAVCPQAQAEGLHAGMTLTQARVFVADLDVRPADPAADAALLERLVAHALRTWSPVAAVTPDDGIWLDLYGTAHLFGGEARFCARVVRFLARLGFTARIAVADSSGAAHALARYGADIVTVVPPGATITAILPLPLDALRLTPEAAHTAKKFGLERIADIIAMPRAPLARRLGTHTLLRLDQATGREVEAIVPAQLHEMPCVTRQLVEPIGTAEAIAIVIGSLVEELAGILEARGHGVRRLCLTFQRVDGDMQSIRLGTAQASRDAKHLTRLLCMKIDTIDPGLGIEQGRLVADRTEPLAALQVSAALAGETVAADVAPLVDQLAGRVGGQSVFCVAPVESDVPERAATRTAPLTAPGRWPGWRRPARLLPRPEPLSNVVALLPDHPPRRFSWRGQPHVVVAGDGPERIHGEWWVRHGELWAVRDYFRVEDSAGRHYWLFRRGDGVAADTGDLSWWMHGFG